MAKRSKINPTTLLQSCQSCVSVRSDQHMTFKLQGEDFISYPARGKCQTVRWLFDQQGKSGRCPKRSQCEETRSLAGLKGQLSWGNRSHGEQWTVSSPPFSLELQPKNIQPCWQAGVNVWHGRSAYASMCFSVNVYASLSGMLHTLGLPGWVIDLQVKGLRVGALHHSNVVSCPFIGFGQSVSPPVSPVDLASVHSDSKGVGQILMTPQHFNQPRAIVHCWVDSIRPWETTERCIVCKSRDISG